jgi:hypothetical protein
MRKNCLAPSPSFFFSHNEVANYSISTHPSRYYPHNNRFSLDHRYTGISVELTAFSRAWPSSTLRATRQPRISPLILILEAVEVKERTCRKCRGNGLQINIRRAELKIIKDMLSLKHVSFDAIRKEGGKGQNGKTYRHEWGSLLPSRVNISMCQLRSLY